MIGVILPSLFGFLGQFEKEGVTKNTIAMFRAARQKAVIKSKDVTVFIEKKKILFDENEISENIKVIKIIEGSKEIKFYTNGSSSGGKIEIETKNGKKLIFKIDVVTGKAIVE